MIKINKVILKGNLTKDVELRTTINNKSVVRFTLAVNEGYRDKQRTNYINCEVWNKTAENLAKYCGKGSLLLIEGNLRVESYEDKDGSKKSVTKVLVENLEFLDAKRKSSAKTSANPLQNSAEDTVEDKEDPFADFNTEYSEDIDELELPFNE